MLLSELEQEALPDFSTHPDYQQLFNTLVGSVQSREQATLLASLWRKRTNNNVPQEHEAPPPPKPQQHLADQELHPGPAEQNNSDQPDHAQAPHEPQPPLQPDIHICRDTVITECMLAVRRRPAYIHIKTNGLHGSGTELFSLGLSVFIECRGVW